MKNTAFGLSIVFAFVICCSGTALAGSAYSKAVQKACAADYHAHCSEYGLESAALRTCMDRNGRSLSQTCVRALVAAGEVSQAEVDRRKKLGR
jgi:hypothetical protein